jgi:predicted choloylglycine hydrolase
MLDRHMPELTGVYDRLVELAGGGDVAARMLSLWQPPPYLASCSQAAYTRGEPMLVRNYDYAPSRLEGVAICTGWNGRRVMGMSDCLWGLLDGMNDAGLALALTFGGRQVVGEGFGIPLVIRYVLQTCTTAAEARAAVARLPVNLAHNLTAVDASGDAWTAFLGPDRPAAFTALPVATNHQRDVEWAEHAVATRSIERAARLMALLADPSLTAAGFADEFLVPPLYSVAYSRGFGTLYTAVYRPARGELELRWPGTVWRQSFAAFREETHTQPLVETVAA